MIQIRIVPFVVPVGNFVKLIGCYVGRSADNRGG